MIQSSLNSIEEQRYSQRMKQEPSCQGLMPQKIQISFKYDETDQDKQKLDNLQEQQRTNIRTKYKEYLTKNRILASKAKRYKDDEEPGQNDLALVEELGNMQVIAGINRQIEDFIIAFNSKPQKAIDNYVAKGLIANNSPQQIAKYLIKIEGLDKQVMGQYFGKNDKSILSILHAYCIQLGFKGMEFDRAIRKLLAKFRLPGEAQQIQRVIWEFALAFYEANVEEYLNADELFPLAYAIIMLATDAHNPQQQIKMTKQDFVTNTRRPCPSIQRQYLQQIYDRITSEKLSTENNCNQALYAKIRDLSMSNLGEAKTFTKELTEGISVLKACYKSKKFVQRKIYLSEDYKKILWVSDEAESSSSQVPRSIEIKDITDLTLGIGSPVMQKNNVPKEFDALCFTITTTHRTLDLKARTSKERAKWINYVRAMLIEKRERRIQIMQKQFKKLYAQEEIDDIWNDEIFSFWDSHWDYDRKKPKVKGYITRGLETICWCWNHNSKEKQTTFSNILKLSAKPTLLESLWALGLPHASRKTLWVIIIGNNLALTPFLIEQIKKRVKPIPEFRQQQPGTEAKKTAEIIIKAAQFLMAMRPDIPPVKDILLLCEVFFNVFPEDMKHNCLSSLANVIHAHHFLCFYRGDKNEIDLRIQLFEHLMQINLPSVLAHFKGLKMETRMFLVPWFISLFGECFGGSFLYRIWDNFLLEGELYLHKVGLALLKYYQIELKMCTFHQGLRMLTTNMKTQEILFFSIIANQLKVSEQDYMEYVEARKYAIIKTKVQSIPLQ